MFDRPYRADNATIHDNIARKAKVYPRLLMDMKPAQPFRHDLAFLEVFSHNFPLVAVLLRSWPSTLHRSYS